MEIDEIIIEEDVDVFGKEDMRLLNIGIKPDLANDWKEANDKKSVFHSDKLLLNPFFNYYISQCTEEEVIAWREYKGRGLRDKQYGTLLTYKNTKVLELTKEVKVHTVENYEELNESLIAENKVLKDTIKNMMVEVETAKVDYKILIAMIPEFHRIANLMSNLTKDIERPFSKTIENLKTLYLENLQKGIEIELYDDAIARINEISNLMNTMEEVNGHE